MRFRLARATKDHIHTPHDLKKRFQRTKLKILGQNHSIDSGLTDNRENWIRSYSNAVPKCTRKRQKTLSQREKLFDPDPSLFSMMVVSSRMIRLKSRNENKSQKLSSRNGGPQVFWPQNKSTVKNNLMKNITTRPRSKSLAENHDFGSFLYF